MHKIFLIFCYHKKTHCDLLSKSKFNDYNIINAVNGMFNNVVYSFVVCYRLLADSCDVFNLAV